MVMVSTEQMIPVIAGSKFDETGNTGENLVSHQVHRPNPVLEIGLEDFAVHETMQISLSNQDVMSCIRLRTQYEWYSGIT